MVHPEKYNCPIIVWLCLLPAGQHRNENERKRVLMPFMEIKEPETVLINKDESVNMDHVQNFNQWLKQYARPYREMMSFYSCAIMEVETKFRVLSEDLSLAFERNPIETIHTRLKSAESIMNKLVRRQFPLSVESIQENIHDIAGVRVVCSFQSDIYMLADAFLMQDDVTLIQRKDYFKNPKPNGYRSLHLIVSVPIFLHNEKKSMKVEVQLRTLAMDLWASTEHKIRYKKDNLISQADNQALFECAESCSEIDRKLEQIYQNVIKSKAKQEIQKV